MSSKPRDVWTDGLFIVTNIDNARAYLPTLEIETPGGLQAIVLQDDAQDTTVGVPVIALVTNNEEGEEINAIEMTCPSWTVDEVLERCRIFACGLGVDPPSRESIVKIFTLCDWQ